MKADGELMGGVNFPSGAGVNFNFQEQLATHPFSNSEYSV